jgi:Acyl carrier protein phosphodiesterase
MGKAMENILHITSSIFGPEGKSSVMSGELIALLTGKHPSANVVERQLSPVSMPYLDAEIFGAFITPAEDRSSRQQDILTLSDTLIEEVKAADAIVLGLPMYNFNVPAALKSYIDHIARVGVTFKYTETGPVGLLSDKPVYVVTARGGYYQGTENDTQTPYIKNILGLLGLKSVEFFHAEGLNISPEEAEKSMEAVRQKLNQRFG